MSGGLHLHPVHPAALHGLHPLTTSVASTPKRHARRGKHIREPFALSVNDQRTRSTIARDCTCSPTRQPRYLGLQHSTCRLLLCSLSPCAARDQRALVSTLKNDDAHRPSLLFEARPLHHRCTLRPLWEILCWPIPPIALLACRPLANAAARLGLSTTTHYCVLRQAPHPAPPQLLKHLPVLSTAHQPAC